MSADPEAVPAADPAPGLYEGIENEAYHRGPGVSKSTLYKLAELSPAHIEVEREHPRDPTPNMAFGTAVHAIVLEPETFEERFCADPAPGSAAKAAVAAREELVAQGFTVVQTAKPGAGFWDRDDWRRVHEIQEAVARHPTASTMLAYGQSEVSAFWQDEETGLLCKCRPDRLDVDVHHLCIDVKTAGGISEKRLRYAITDYGYHVQAAFYLDGLAAAGAEVTDFIFLFIETAPPYGIKNRTLESKMIQKGRDEYHYYLKRYARCVEAGEWPAFPPEIDVMLFPDWTYK
jgi:hypothetical protein